MRSYLWPNLEAGLQSRSFVLSVMWLVNEKVRERAAVWDFAAQSRERVAALFGRLCDAQWLRAAALTRDERVQLLRFLIGSYQALSNDHVRAEVLKLVHVPLWDAVSDVRRNVELCDAPKSIQKQWRMLASQKAKGKSFSRETSFFPFLFETFFAVLDDAAHCADEQLYVQRFLELCIDLLAQLPTRRYFRMFLDDQLLLARVRSVQSSLAPLTVKLVQMLKFYVDFEVDEFTGAALSAADVARLHAARITRLQEVAFRTYGSDNPHMRALAVANVGAVSSRASLEGFLKPLDDAALATLAAAVGIDASGKPRALVQEALVLQCQARSSQLEAINKMPLYPTENLLWDSSVIPSDSYMGLEPLALPKLNLQFLTFYDYLLRNYTLYRLEAVDDLAHHVRDVVSRMRPTTVADGRIKFEGWARMALPLRASKIIHVAEPLLGDDKPGEVRAEVTYSVHNFTGELRTEWEALARHDVVFLLTLTEPSATSSPFGLVRIRGGEIADIFDEDNTRMKLPGQRRNGNVRRLVLKMDPAQYHLDLLEDSNARASVYESFNLLLRRRPRENTFKGVLETVRTLINAHDVTVPAWLVDVFLGYGNAKGASPDPHAWLDYGDTFLSAEHLRACFAGRQLRFAQGDAAAPPFRLRTADDGVLEAASSAKLDGGPFPDGPVPRMNRVPFTGRQLDAIGSGAREGLTLVVGPPGTGKTDVAVQILSLLVRNHPEQRTVMLTHSNTALNQIFEKLIGLDIDPTQMVRLGYGEKMLSSTESFSQSGRVDALLARRLTLLAEVDRLAHSLGMAQAASFTCETAGHFFFQHVLARWEKFERDAEAAGTADYVMRHFPFSAFFAAAPRQPAFADLEGARACYRHLQRMFTQLADIQPLEVLRNQMDRNKFVLAKHSRIVAMTVTYAALQRQQLVKMGFRFDSVVMEEAGQVKEIESLIPLLMQEDRARLKRVVLIGDDNQLPPVVKNEAFQRYSNLDQSLFARFIRLGVPHVLLDSQGRCRPELADLFNWRYPQLGNLPHIGLDPSYAVANAGLRWTYQFIDVPDYQGVGEYSPKAHFFQNLGEAEYVVALFMYLRSLGYPASSISMLTTYRGQKHLLRDVVERRCASLAAYGRPAAISTVDKYQGQQNAIVLMSLVRTKHAGYLRDVRRLVVAMSRARVGLYVFGRLSLYQNVYELTPVFSQLLKRPSTLQVTTNGERFGHVTRLASDADVPTRDVKDCGQMAMLAVGSGRRE